MEVRALIDLSALARRMSAESGRSYTMDSAAAFLRGAGCRTDGEHWIVPVIVLGALRSDEIRIASSRDDSQAS